MMNELEINDSEPMCVVAPDHTCDVSAIAIVAAVMDDAPHLFFRGESEFEPQKKRQCVNYFQGIFIPPLAVQLANQLYRENGHPPLVPKAPFNEFDRFREYCHEAGIQ